MRATSSLTRMGAAAREQLRGASAVGSKTDEPRPRALHRQHSRANARETEQMCGDSSSGGAHFSMCTFDRAECTDGRVLAAGGAAIRGSTGRSSEFSDRVLDRNSSDANYRGRTFVMYHGTTWRHWQRIRQHGFLLSNSASGLGAGVYLTRNEKKAEFYKKNEWGVIIKVRVALGKMITIDGQGHHLQKSWQMAGYDSAFAPAGAIGRREENCVLDPSRITILGLAQGYRPKCRHGGACSKIDRGCRFDHGGLSDTEDGGQHRSRRGGTTRRNKRKSPAAKRQAAARHRRWSELEHRGSVMEQGAQLQGSRKSNCRGAPEQGSSNA